MISLTTYNSQYVFDLNMNESDDNKTSSFFKKECNSTIGFASIAAQARTTLDSSNPPSHTNTTNSSFNRFKSDKNTISHSLELNKPTINSNNTLFSTYSITKEGKINQVNKAHETETMEYNNNMITGGKKRSRVLNNDSKVEDILSQSLLTSLYTDI